jgi:hypothetical protein
MRLYRYQNFIKESKEDIHSICRKYSIQNYIVNEDGTVDVDGSVNFYNIGLTELPIKFRFRNVSGHFSSSNNKLTSLEGSPRSVSGIFNCCNNELTSLEGSPRSVGGDFYCDSNKLTSLSGAPREVGDNFVCYNNKLTSLEGISKYISGGIYCKDNQLRDVKGVPDGWRGEFYVEGNPVYEIFKLFPQERWDEVIEYLNEYEVIRGNVIAFAALEIVFYEMGLEVPEIEKIEGYDIQY